jgi:hypothetical protein
MIPSIIKNKKAQGTFGVFNWMIVAFLTVVFFAGLIYAMGLINGVMHDVGVQNDKQNGSATWVNLTQASNETFGVLNQSIQALRMVAIVYILGLAVLVIVGNAMIKVHPIYFFAYILICLLAVIFSVPISNAYQTLYTSSIYNGLLTTFSASNWILLNLPVITLFISVFGGIFMFISIIRTGGEDKGL